MTLSTLLFFLAIGHAFAQSTPTCPAISIGAARGAFAAFPDRDPNFLYSRDNCSSTSQKIISDYWTSSCQIAIQNVCSSTSPNSANVGSWNWAWSNDRGQTCQVSIWQPEAPQSTSSVKSPVGITTDCCVSTFQALVNTTASQISDNGGALPPNRGSINIAQEGYPFALATVDGTQTLTDGVQVTQGYPSFVIQG